VVLEHLVLVNSLYLNLIDVRWYEYHV